MLYQFGEYTLDKKGFRLARNDSEVSIEPQVFDLLAYLVENAGRIVSKDELLETIWEGRAVSESALSSRIKAARRAVGDDGSRQEFIRTVHRRGFSFVADVSGSGPTISAAVVDRNASLPTGDEPASTTVQTEALTRRVMERPAVAVLPLANYDAEAGNDYLSAGITDEIIAALAAWRSFPVIARTTAFRYRNTDKSARQIGAEIGARYLVTGTLLRANGRFRITASLIDCETEQEIWSDRFQRDFDDVFSIEEELAREVVSAITAQINAAEVGRIYLKPTTELSAWELAMRANWLVHQPSREMLDEAEKLANMAAEIDPSWGFPRGLVAFARFQKAMHNWFESEPSQAFSETHKAAREAIEVDGTSWLGHALCGVGELWSHHNHDKALAHLHQALHINPSACWSYHFCGCITGFSGDLEAARSLQPRAFTVDPVYPYTGVLRADLALWSMLGGYFDEAEGHIDRSIEWDPSYGRALHRSLALLGMTNQKEEAAALRRQIEEVAKRALDPVYIRESYPFKVEEHRDRFFDGLRRAGVNI